MSKQAAEAVRCRMGVLPFEHVGASDKFILKMHGCVKHKDSIVLTRQDYIRYNDTRAALTGTISQNVSLLLY